MWDARKKNPSNKNTEGYIREVGRIEASAFALKIFESWAVASELIGPQCICQKKPAQLSSWYLTISILDKGHGISRTQP